MTKRFIPTNVSEKVGVKPLIVASRRQGKKIRKLVSLRMSQLIDRWSLDAFLFLVFLKILQFLKFLGIRSELSGWRNVSSAIMRNDVSKFMLAKFRLTPFEQPPASMNAAEHCILERISEFISSHEDLHWKMQEQLFHTSSQRTQFIDVMTARFLPDGSLESVSSFFDKRRPLSSLISEDDIKNVLSKFVRVYNRCRQLPDSKRARRLYSSVKNKVLYKNTYTLTKRQEMVQMLNRIMDAAWLSFQYLPQETCGSSAFTAARIATPDISLLRHPGWGLLNVIVRIHPALTEADIWVQYHHVPVDGLPMQELLDELVAQWGVAGPMKFPAPDSPASETEILRVYGTKSLYRARTLCDFSRFLAIRKKINALHSAEMHGSATIAGMILWALGNSPALNDVKMLFPVAVDNEDDTHSSIERELSLIFIRPTDYFVQDDPLSGFIAFQREFNRRVIMTRARHSETYEMMDLLTMIHPSFFFFARTFMPRAFREVVGTFGLSVLHHADIFIAPRSDVQSNGFLAFGRMDMPCEDGSTAGAVSICGTLPQIHDYLAALNNLAGTCEILLQKKRPRW